MNNTANLKRKLKSSFAATLVVMICLWQMAAHATVRLSNDWHPQTGVTDIELELELLETEGMIVTNKLNAVVSPPFGEPIFEPAFRLYIDEVTYYIEGAMFMSKSRPDEVCTALGGHDYKCKEGQNYTHKSHLLFFNGSFNPVGTYQFKINEPYEYFVNAMPAMGVYNKVRNELLVTVRYFPINQKAASKVSEIGSGWRRMTILFRVKAVDGKIEVEQDDTCLRNPNRIETIPDAKKALKACAVVRRGK
ncbi:MAG: hypothetical protein HHJ16_10285 [Polaromonas sp.]|uniref:hypothetical protein n=1 Tax=Polaromonas sp. TaxID=1869339 RepID=UPI001855B7E6|nr:hypothetical protein [Polaromonas sp.]NMM10650.1 hypothetical protein [Polaromonas sp.]